MSKFNRLKTCLLIVALAISGNAAAQVVSPFAGSTLQGSYSADFVNLRYLVPSGDDFDIASAKGQLLSRIYQRPADKSNFEVISSFEESLTDAGFDIITSSDKRSRIEILLRQVNGRDANALGQRQYRLGDTPTATGAKARVETQAQEYLVARKRIGDADFLVAISTSRSEFYVIDELHSAAMEEGTVTLTLDALRDAMTTEGRIAIYGLYFDTGSAALKPESDEALQTMVDYLGENSQRNFYVVGHTDDEGNFDSNMALSSARAESVIDELSTRLPSASGQLVAYGVGPLSPVATNDDGEGRARNRRVELVSRIEN